MLTNQKYCVRKDDAQTHPYALLILLIHCRYSTDLLLVGLGHVIGEGLGRFLRSW